MSPRRDCRARRRDGGRHAGRHQKDPAGRPRPSAAPRQRGRGRRRPQEQCLQRVKDGGAKWMNLLFEQLMQPCFWISGTLMQCEVIKPLMEGHLAPTSFILNQRCSEDACGLPSAASCSAAARCLSASSGPSLKARSRWRGTPCCTAC